MDWSIVMFSAAVAWPAAALFKYSFLLIDRLMFKHVLVKTVAASVNGDMKTEILETIRYISQEATTKALYSGKLQFIIEGEEGSHVVKITRTDSVEEARE